MSTQTSPINGNQSFTHVSNQAEQLPHVNVSDATIGTLKAGAVRANIILPSNGVETATTPVSVFSGKTLHSTIGYIPTTTTGGTAGWFNKVAGAGVSNAVTDILLLPPGALVVGAFLFDSNNTYAGGATGVGIEAAAGAAPAGATDIFAVATQANIRKGVTVGSAVAALGTAGVSTSSIPVPTAGNTGVSIEPTNAAVSTGVTITIYYLI